MQDTTVSGLRFASDSGVNTGRRFFGRTARYSGEDELLARVLITSWSLTTGRTLRSVAPQALTEDELISFWADDTIAGAGCRLPCPDRGRLATGAGVPAGAPLRPGGRGRRGVLGRAQGRPAPRCSPPPGGGQPSRSRCGTCRLELTPAAPADPADGTPWAPPGLVLPELAPLPGRPDGTRYPRYSDALRALAAPALFENRPTYRLTEAELAPGASRLAFTAAATSTPWTPARRPRTSSRPPGSAAGAALLRALLADPCDLRRRPVNLAISTLTLRRDGDRASFLLHWRDPAKVGHAGGMYQVIPVGIFQPSGPEPWHERRDFSLWRCMLREFDEELRDRSEDYRDLGPGPVDYESWPFARRMTAALDQGQIQAWCLGLGVDPLTYATDLLTVAVIDSRLFDELFSLAPRPNAEGSVLAAREFAAHVMNRVVNREPVQAAGAALLRLAWHHRDTLLDS